MKKLTTEEFIERAQKVHNNRYDYSKVIYVNSRTKVEIICPIHGSFWQNANSHLLGSGCSKCYHESKILSQDEFLRKALQVHGNRYNYSKAVYTDTKTPVCIICPEHGEFFQTPNVHISNGSGCPKCSISKGEEMIMTFLKSNQINYIYNYKIPIDSEINAYGYALIDFYLPEYNIAIEYNGEQHYIASRFFGGQLFLEHQQQRDEYVRRYCNQAGMKLVEIKYNQEKDQIIELLRNILNF